MQDSLGYRNKRVLVSGCHSGIGYATAQALVELGAHVHGLDLKSTDLALQAFSLCDLRECASINAAVDTIEGPIDYVFNCAGMPPGPAPMDILKVNFLGTKYLTERVLAKMHKGGAIVNVASNGGMGWQNRLSELQQLVSLSSFDGAVRWLKDRVATLGPAYSYSKEALIVWTLTISQVLIKQGIRVNCTCPGAVQTPMLVQIEQTIPSAVIDAMAEPIGRRSLAEEQAHPLLFLNSDAASYVNGAILHVDGGFAGARACRQE